MIQHLKNLQQIGLNHNQAKTYVTVLELGPSTVGQIAKKSDVIRTTIYDNIRVLKSYGLLTEVIRNGKHLITAESPRALGNLLERKKQIIEESIPDLMQIFESTKVRPKIQFFEGIKGIEKILDLSVYDNKSKVTQIMGDITTLFSWIPEPNIKIFTAKRTSRGIKNYAITSTSLERLKKTNMLDPVKHKQELREMRIPPKEMAFPLLLYCYDQNVALISSTKEGFSILVESKEFADTFRSLFSLIWPLCKEV